MHVLLHILGLVAWLHVFFNSSINILRQKKNGAALNTKDGKVDYNAYYVEPYQKDVSQE